MILRDSEKVTLGQIMFGQLLGLDLHGEYVSVAFARIEDKVDRDFLGKSNLGSPSDKQIALAKRFGFEISHESKRIGDAVVDMIMKHLNLRAIEDQGLEPGVRVRFKDSSFPEYIISSIQEDGVVYFKGGNGKRANARNIRRIESEEPSR